MASLACELPAKLLKALTLGLIRDDFYYDLEISREELYNEIFPPSPSPSSSSSSSDEGREFGQNLSSFLQTAAQQHWGVATLTQQLTQRGMSAEHATDVVGKVWKQEQTKIHQVMVQKSVWGKQFSGVSWRVDVRQQRKNQQVARVAQGEDDVKQSSNADEDDSAERLSAILQVKFKSTLDQTQNNFQFELSPAKARELLHVVEEIETHLNAPSK